MFGWSGGMVRTGLKDFGWLVGVKIKPQFHSNVFSKLLKIPKYSQRTCNKKFLFVIQKE
jgi:hypothetical protein